MVAGVCSPPEHVLASRFHLHVRTLVVLVNREAEGSCALAAARLQLHPHMRSFLLAETQLILD